MKVTHWLRWRRFRMACGKRPQDVEATTSYWAQVTCPACKDAREPGDTEPDA